MKSNSDGSSKGSLNQGFTLIEIMIVLAIIGILVIVAVPDFRKMRTDQSLHSCAEQLKADIRYTQQIALDSQDEISISYDLNSYTVTSVSTSKIIKSVQLEYNVQFVDTGNITIGRDGIPVSSGVFPVIITLGKQNSKVYVKVYSGGKVDVSWS